MDSSCNRPGRRIAQHPPREISRGSKPVPNHRLDDPRSHQDARSGSRADHCLDHHRRTERPHERMQLGISRSHDWATTRTGSHLKRRTKVPTQCDLAPWQSHERPCGRSSASSGRCDDSWTPRWTRSSRLRPSALVGIEEVPDSVPTEFLDPAPITFEFIGTNQDVGPVAALLYARLQVQGTPAYCI
jgi:hypothetical protein